MSREQQSRAQQRADSSQLAFDLGVVGDRFTGYIKPADSVLTFAEFEGLDEMIEGKQSIGRQIAFQL